jgi:hypothetical protein
MNRMSKKGKELKNKNVSPLVKEEYKTVQLVWGVWG